MNLRPRRAAALIVTVLTALALAFTVAGPASAATRGGGLQPEHFTIKVINQFSLVVADGPVHGTGTWQDTANPALGVIVFDRGTVNVWHDPTPQPNVDRRSCTATVTQFGHWAFKGGTGKYARAFGFGHFKLFLFAVLQRLHHHRCDLNPNDQPVLIKVFVTADGLATAGGRR